MSTQEPEQATHYRETSKTTKALRLPGAGWPWVLGLALAIATFFGVNALSMTWWFSYFTGVLPGYDSHDGWWSLGGGAVRWFLGPAIGLTVGAALSHLTRSTRQGRTLTVWCFRRSAPSLKLVLGLLASFGGAMLYAALDDGQYPVVDTARDRGVLIAFWVMAAATGALVVIFTRDLVRVEVRSDGVSLCVSAGSQPVVELRALAVDRFVLRTRELSETLFLAGWFPKRPSEQVGAYAVAAACAVNDAQSARVEATTTPSTPGEMVELPSAPWPWWLGGAAGSALAGFILWEASNTQYTGYGTAFALLAAWMLAVLVGRGLSFTRVRRIDDAAPIRFRLLLAEARTQQQLPAIAWLRRLGIGLLGATVLGGLAAALLFVIGIGAVLVLAPLWLLYPVVTFPGVCFPLANALRLLRDGRTVVVNETGAWLGGQRITACESIGGAVVATTGLEPTWLRVISMSRDAAEWRREADAIARYVRRHLASPGGNSRRNHPLATNFGPLTNSTQLAPPVVDIP